LRTKQIDDILLASDLIKYINRERGTSFEYYRELDIKRDSANTPPQPEAEFWDYSTGKKAVVEIKNYVYTIDRTGSPAQPLF
jgi:hypothetical protein